MPAVGVYFGLYQFVKKQMDAKDDVSPYLSITVSAGIGNFIARYVFSKVHGKRIRIVARRPREGSVRLSQRVSWCIIKLNSLQTTRQPSSFIAYLPLVLVPRSFFRVPYEVVKQRLQVGAYPGTMIALQSIYKEVGNSV